MCDVGKCIHLLQNRILRNDLGNSSSILSVQIFDSLRNDMRLKSDAARRVNHAMLVVMFTLQAVAMAIFLAFILKEHALPRFTGCSCTESSSVRLESPPEYPDNTSK